MSADPLRNRQYKPELRERAGELYLKHGNLSQVARDMGISRARASVLVRESGVPTKPRGRPRAG